MIFVPGIASADVVAACRVVSLTPACRLRASSRLAGTEVVSVITRGFSPDAGVRVRNDDVSSKMTSLLTVT